MLEYLHSMKILPLQRDEKKNRVSVTCAEGTISVYSHCAYCIHCKGIQVKGRTVPPPQRQVLDEMKRGSTVDENLMNAAMMFNTFIRDGTAIECDDDAGTGYERLY